MPRRALGELLEKALPELKSAFRGSGDVQDALLYSKKPRYEATLHLRTLDFIEGRNATDAGRPREISTS